MCCEQGMRMPEFKVLTLKQGKQFLYKRLLNRESLWTGSHKWKEFKYGNEQSKWVVPTILILKNKSYPQKLLSFGCETKWIKVLKSDPLS